MGVDAQHADRLTELERVIDRGLATFVEVGAALTEIREQRLYKLRDGYSSFEQYCKDRWGFNRQRASQLIQAAAVSTIVDTSPLATDLAAPRLRVVPPVSQPSRVDQLSPAAAYDAQLVALENATAQPPPKSPPVPNEAVARELAPLKNEPEKMRAAWASATAMTDKPTATAVRAAVRHVTASPANNLPSKLNRDLLPEWCHNRIAEARAQIDNAVKMLDTVQIPWEGNPPVTTFHLREVWRAQDEMRATRERLVFPIQAEECANPPSAAIAVREAVRRVSNSDDVEYVVEDETIAAALSAAEAERVFEALSSACELIGNLKPPREFVGMLPFALDEYPISKYRAARSWLSTFLRELDEVDGTS